MSDRFRTPVDDEYLLVLGRAAYNFAYLEWGVFWLAENLLPGFIRDAQSRTSGRNATAFRRLIEETSLPDNLRGRLEDIAGRFASLTARRDALLHGRPYTAPGGEQRLAYRGRHPDEQWTVAKISDAAHEFEALSLSVGDVMYGDLAAFIAARPVSSSAHEATTTPPAGEVS